MLAAALNFHQLVHILLEGPRNSQPQGYACYLHDDLNCLVRLEIASYKGLLDFKACECKDYFDVFHQTQAKPVSLKYARQKRVATNCSSKDALV